MESHKILLVILVAFLSFTVCKSQIVKEWGVINERSIRIHLKEVSAYLAQQSKKEDYLVGYTIFQTNVLISGIRVTNLNFTTGNVSLTDGGIGFNYTRIDYSDNVAVHFRIEIFRNGTEEVTTTTTQGTTSTQGVTTTQGPTTTPQEEPTTTQEPENDVVIIGTVNDNSKHIFNDRFGGYPEFHENATGNIFRKFTKTIHGIRLTSLNNTKGRVNILNGGIDSDNVEIEFAGPELGQPYDFSVEIFENSATMKSLSIAMILMSYVLIAFFK